MCEDTTGEAANAGYGALSVLFGNKIVEQLVTVVRFIPAEGAPGEVLTQELVPNLLVS